MLFNTVMSNIYLNAHYVQQEIAFDLSKVFNCDHSVLNSERQFHL